MNSPRCYDTATEAIFAVQEGEVAIRLDGIEIIVPLAQAHELEKEGVQFAYLHHLIREDGSRVVVTVLVNQ